MIAILTHSAALAIGILIGWWVPRWLALRTYDEQMSVAHRRGPIAQTLPPDDRQAAIDVMTVAGLFVIATAFGYAILSERITANLASLWQ